MGKWEHRISVDSAEKAIQLVKEVQEICSKGKHLHKCVSNSRKVLDAIPESECASVVKDLNNNKLSMESVLGEKWNVETHSFSFNVLLNEKAATRRGILSKVARVYDPLGFLSP